MSGYSIIDSTGEVISQISVPDASHLALNTPAGASSVAGFPPSTSCYFSAGGWVQYPPRPSENHQWDKQAKIWVDQRTLAQHQFDKWASIKASRDADITTPKTTSVGQFDADEASQNNLNKVIALVQIAAAAGKPANANYTLSTNARVNLTLAQLQTAALEMGAQVQALYDKADSLRTQINAATTIAAVEAVVW